MCYVFIVLQNIPYIAFKQKEKSIAQNVVL